MTSQSTVVITGANTGLGYEVVKALVRSDSAYHIFLGCRSLDKGTEAIKAIQAEISQSKSEVEAVQIDITDDASIQRAFEAVQKKVSHIDVLLNNAGAQFDHQYTAGKMGQREMWNTNYDTNVSSTNIVTQTFAPLLIASPQARLIFISSGTASLDEASRGLPRTATVPPAGWPKPPAFSFTSYRCTKVAVTMMMLEWKRILGADPVKIFALSPGFLATNLGNVGAEKMKELGAIDPTIGAKFVKDVIDGKRDEDHGKTVNKDGIMPW